MEQAEERTDHGSLRARRARWLVRASLVLVSLAGALVLSEFACRRLLMREARVESFALVRDRYLGRTLPIFEEQGGGPRWLRPGGTLGNGVRINALGFRGPEVAPAPAPDTLRVVCLGGSSVFGTANTSDAATWPAQLGQLASERLGRPVEVLNGGVPGYHAHQSVERFEQLFADLQPDVAVLYNLYNDVLESRIRQLGFDRR